MVGRSFVVLTLLLCFVRVQGQDSLKHGPDRFLFSASVGAGFPVSGFTKNDPYPPQTGKVYKAGFTYLPFRVFGFDLSFSKTINETQIPAAPVVVQFGGLGNPHPYMSYVYWSGAWQTSNYYLDAVFQPNTKTVHVRFKAGGGVQTAVTPPVHIYYFNGNYSEDTEGAKKNVFVFHAGIDVRIKMIKGLGLLLSQDVYDSVVDLPNGSIARKNIFIIAFSAGLTYSIK